MKASRVETQSPASFPAYQAQILTQTVFMKDLSKLILPLGFVAIVGACAPYPPLQNSQQQAQQEQAESNTPQQTVGDEEQRQIEESRRRLEREEAKRKSQESSSNNASLPTKPARPNYPTATAVPGKEGFVFNPYTQNIVDVKGIAPGKLVRDPEDADATHKFRVP